MLKDLFKEEQLSHTSIHLHAFSYSVSYKVSPEQEARDYYFQTDLPDWEIVKECDKEDLIGKINRNKDIIVDLERTSPHVCFCLIEKSLFDLIWFSMPGNKSDHAPEDKFTSQKPFDSNTLLTQTDLSLDQRLSVESVSTLQTQETLSVHEDKEETLSVSSISREDIEKEEKDLKEVFSPEELYFVSFRCYIYSEQLWNCSIPKVRNAQDVSSLLDDPTPFIYTDSQSIKVPAAREVECVVVDKQRLEKREEVLKSLSRPYHPFFYTTVNRTEN